MVRSHVHELGAGVGAGAGAGAVCVERVRANIRLEHEGLLPLLPLLKLTLEGVQDDLPRRNKGKVWCGACVTLLTSEAARAVQFEIRP